MGEWIKCSERLPEGTEDVLVADQDYQAVAYWSYGAWQASNMDCGANHRITVDFEPTHWQPLPEPPEQQ